MYSQKQADDMIAAAVKKAMELQPKKSQFFQWAPIVLVVVAWFAQVFLQAGFYGQRMNTLESSMHDLTANSMPTNTVQAKFDETNHILRMQQDQLSEIEKEMHELNARH